MAIRMGLPVFVAPINKAVKDGVVQSMALSDGGLTVRIRNKGNSHLILSRIKAKGIDAAGAETFVTESPGWYVLAGSARDFAVDVAKEGCLKTKEIKAIAETDADKVAITGSLAVDPALCAEKPAPVPREQGVK